LTPFAGRRSGSSADQRRDLDHPAGPQSWPRSPRSRRRGVGFRFRRGVGRPARTGKPVSGRPWLAGRGFSLPVCLFFAAHPTISRVGPARDEDIAAIGADRPPLSPPDRSLSPLPRRRGNLRRRHAGDLRVTDIQFRQDTRYGSAMHVKDLVFPVPPVLTSFEPST
jgi:hypothetical protein